MKSDNRRLGRLGLIVAVVLGIAVLMLLPGPAGLPRGFHATPPVQLPAFPTSPTSSARVQAELSSMGALAYTHWKPTSGLGSPPSASDPSPSSIPVNAVRFTNDSSQLPQTETSVAVDHANTNHVVGAFNDFRGFFCNPIFVPPFDPVQCPNGIIPSITGFTSSANGGSTVLQSGDWPGVRNTTSGAVAYSYGDPKVGAGPGGIIYGASLLIDPFTGYSGIEVLVNTSGLFAAPPGTICWTPTSALWTNPCWTSKAIWMNWNNTLTFEDKENMAVDWNPTSPYYGDVYLSWDHFTAVGPTPLNSTVARCTPTLNCVVLGGIANDPVSTPTNPFADWSDIAVSPANGTAYVTFCNFGTAVAPIPWNCSVNFRAPSSLTWGTPHMVAGIGGPLAVMPGFYPIFGLSTEQFRTESFPGVTATVSGVYFQLDVCNNAGYYANYFGTPSFCGSSGILFASYTGTWSTPSEIINPGIITQSFITTDLSNNNLVLTYYTTQYDPFQHRVDVAIAVSSNGGSSWNQFRLTNISAEPYDDPLIPIGFAPTYGDYYEATAVGGQVWSVFTGTYAVINGTFQLDPFLGSISESGPLGVTATATPNPTEVGVAAKFTATTSNAIGTVTDSWAFGDGTSGSGASPSWAYAAAGTYTATVWASEGVWGSASASVKVVVNASLGVTAVFGPAAPTTSTAISFFAVPSGGVGAVTINWTFGDGNTATGSSPTHTYTATGTFTVTVKATDALGATATKTLTVTVTAAPAPPTPSSSSNNISPTTALEYTILALIAGLVVGLAVGWAMKRRGSSTPPPAGAASPPGASPPTN